MLSKSQNLIFCNFERKWWSLSVWGMAIEVIMPKKAKVAQKRPSTQNFTNGWKLPPKLCLQPSHLKKWHFSWKSKKVMNCQIVFQIPDFTIYFDKKAVFFLVNLKRYIKDLQEGDIWFPTQNFSFYAIICYRKYLVE